MAVWVEYADGSLTPPLQELNAVDDAITVMPVTIHNDTRASLLNLRYVMSGIPHTVRGCPDTLAAHQSVQFAVELSGVDIVSADPQQDITCSATYDMLYAY